MILWGTLIAHDVGLKDRMHSKSKYKRALAMARLSEISSTKIMELAAKIRNDFNKNNPT